MTKINRAKIENLLLAPAEMNEVYQKLHRQKFKYPYFYKITKANQFLYFVGPHHIFDPKDPQIKTIKSYWKKFLEDTGGINCTVVIEGGLRPLRKTAKEAIERYGEPGYMTFLAKEKGIKVISPEPDDKMEADLISKIFGREKTIYYYFARQVNQWHKYLERPSFEKYIQRLLRKYKRILNWKTFDFSLKHMVLIHNKYHNHEFNKDNYDCFFTDSNPINSKICAASSKLRDTHIAENIINLWRRGKNTFSVYGSGHAITLEPALKKLIK